MSKLSAKQSEKEIKVLEYFYSHPNVYMREMSREIHIPRATIQRYLQKNSNTKIPGTNITIRQQLEINKSRGNREGGIESFKSNDSTKDNKGRFTGSKKTTFTEDKEQLKKEDIKRICTFFINHKDKTLDELASELSEAGLYTRDYIYDCLTDKRIKNLLGEETFDEIRNILDSNRKSFLKKINEMNVDELISISSLTEQEREIIIERLDGKTLDQISEELHLSRSALLKHENSAIEKMKKNITMGKNK